MSIAEWREMPKGDYWIPVPAGAAYFARLRDDYNEKAAWTDEQLNDYFNENDQKYPTTWDHVGDAYSEYEPLADSYFALRDRLRDTAECLRIFCEAHDEMKWDNPECHGYDDARAILKRLKEEGLM